MFVIFTQQSHNVKDIIRDTKENFSALTFYIIIARYHFYVEHLRIIVSILLAVSELQIEQNINYKLKYFNMTSISLDDQGYEESSCNKDQPTAPKIPDAHLEKV